MQRGIYLVAESDLSFDEIASRLGEAMLEQFGRDISGDRRFYIYETFPAYVIARGPDMALFRVPYAMDGDAVTFGDAQEVETAYVPVAEACTFIATEADGQAEDSAVFPIVALRAGWGTGAVAGQSVPHYYPASFVSQVAEALSSKPFGRRHPDQRGPDPTGALDPGRIAGYLGAGRFDGAQALTEVNLFAAESDLRSKLSEARRTKTLGNFAVSMLAMTKFVPAVIEGRQCLSAQSLVDLISVDLCARAGAGGQFLAAASFAGADFSAAQVAAVKPNTTAIHPTRGRGGNQGGASRVARIGVTMNKHLQQLLEALRKKNADKAGEFYSRAVVATEAEQVAMEAEVITALAEGATAIAAEAGTALAELQRAQARNRIEGKLLASRLGEPAKKEVRRHLEVMLASEAKLGDDKIDAEITATRTAFAAFENVGRVRIGTVELDSHDKMALAMEGMLGVKTAQGKGVPAFRGIKQAYLSVTGDSDFSRLSAGTGFSGHVLTAEAAIGTGDFPNLLLDALHKRLAQDYAELGLDGLDELYTAIDIDDYKMRNVIRDGYFGEMPIVPENTDYQELAHPTDERMGYVPQKRGGLLTISEETIRNDDLSAISRWPGKLARASRNTLRSFIVNFFANNPIYGADNLSIFHASHKNLGTDSFGLQGLRNAQLALRRQQEKDSGEYLGLPLRWLAVPPELEALAIQINQTSTAGSSDFYQRFGANNERIYVVEKFTDVNDWYYGTDTSAVPLMEIGFLDGKKEPEVLLANQPTVGKMFTTDQLQYKVKFVWGGTLTDYRGVGKNVVT